MNKMKHYKNKDKSKYKQKICLMKEIHKLIN